MGCSVLTHNASPVDGKNNRKSFDTNIMKYLIISTLQKSRIYGHHRLEPFSGQARGKCYAVLFGDSDIKKPIRISLCKFNKTCTFGHGGGHRNNPVVGFCHFEQGFSKNFRICRNTILFLYILPCIGIKASNTVKIGGILFSWRVSLALLCCHMK